VGPAAAHVRLSVYDMLGREVAVLVDEQKAPGTYAVRFNAQKLASGVYLYRLQISGTGYQFVDTKRMVVVK
jgi:hypothetical protein